MSVKMRRCFQLLFLLLFIWGFTTLFNPVISSISESNQWNLPELGGEWLWDKFPAEENILGELARLPKSKVADSKNRAKLIGGSKINIIIWLQAPRSFALKKRYGDLETSMKTNNLCLEECQLSFSRKLAAAAVADAIVFYELSLGSRPDFPVRSNWDQIWVYQQQEPPTVYIPGLHLNGLFNWTMTYRKDSDIHRPYYRIFPLAEPLAPTEPLNFGNGAYNSSEWINGKSKLATVFMSNCEVFSKRLPILKKLQSSGIPIDIYGKCGNNRSIPGYWEDDGETVFLEISRKYWFNFAIEDSICWNYVTEKFWRTLEQGMVPIVMGRANYLEIAPPNSFIDLKDFPNPSDLKEYLDFLVGNPEAYLKFFEWRRQYRVVRDAENLCDLCAKLRQHKKRRPNDPYQYKVQENLGAWWGSIPGMPDQPACITPEDFGFQNYLQNQPEEDINVSFQL